MSYASDLKEHTVLKALSIDSAQTLFEKFRETIDIIVFDGYIGNSGSKHTTIKLASKIREVGFKGPMIAASSDVDMRYALAKQGGCSHSIRESKDEIPEIIQLILSQKDLPPPF